MIKAVLFDFGGVLSEAGASGSVRGWLGKAYGLDIDVQKVSDVFRRMWRGQVDDEEFLAAIRQQYPDAPAVTKNDLMNNMQEFTRSAPVYALALSLRAHNIATGILSNVFGMGAARLKAGGFYDDFNPVLLSSDAGYAKPDKEFYELAVQALGVHPNEILFIDDQQYALDPAAAMGMYTILATSPQQIVRDTKALIKQQNNVDL